MCCRFSSTGFAAQHHLVKTALYGRQFTYQWLKQAGIPVTHNQTFSLLKELDPGELESRKSWQDSQQWGGYFVSGPNYMWSIDGHHKLSMYSTGVYVEIDAYFQYSLPPPRSWHVQETSYNLIDIFHGYILVFLHIQVYHVYINIWKL